MKVKYHCHHTKKKMFSSKGRPRERSEEMKLLGKAVEEELVIGQMIAKTIFQYSVCSCLDFCS